MIQQALNIYPQPDIELLHGDCREVMKSFDSDCIDLTVTSPPYDNLRTYNNKLVWDWDVFTEIADQLYRITKKGGVVVWVVGDATIKGSETGTSFKQALYFKDVGFNLHDTMIFQARGTGAKGSRYSYWQGFEYMFVFSKDKPKAINLIADIKNKTIGLVRQGRYRQDGNKEVGHKTNEVGTRTNIWPYNVGFMDKSDKTKHPAPFPEQLAHDHIISWSNKGDTILDPMMGSGTTGKMAKRLNRNFIGIEKDTEYFKIAQDRIRG